MKISFHGAAQTVTGSMHLLSINGHRILLDCGFYQGRRKESYERNLNFPFNPKTISAVLLSHAHIDHSANLPNLVKQGFEGPIYATPATSHLTDIMTRDTGHILESDSVFVNKKRAKRGEDPIEPIYTIEDAARAAWQLTPQPYEHTFEVVPGIQARFVEAGHILGSAGIVLDINDHGKHKRIMFSGDIGRRDLPILRDPVLPEDIDYLIMESTYGDRNHDHPDKGYENLLAVLQRTLERGGKVIIPAFAVGRTQTLVYFIHQMMDRGHIPEVPVFVDSPLAINVTDIFRQHPECFDKEMLEFRQNDPQGSALGFNLLKYTRSVEESKRINKHKGPAIIISASGMAEVGRILHHLRNNIHDARSTILITSWVAPHTLARRLLEGNSEVRIFGRKYPVVAEVAHINGFSAHAGQDFLLEYALASRQSLKHIYLVHGEKRAAEAFMEKVKQTGFTNISFPESNQRVEI